MIWSRANEVLSGHLPPEVSGFLAHVLHQLEADDVCDAPSVISGVLAQMRRAESVAVQNAVGRTEKLLASAFSHRGLQRVSA